MAAIVQEFSKDPQRDSQHRLVCKITGEVTAWAGYRQATYLRGMVGFTAYFAAKEGVMEAHKFCEMTMVGRIPT